ncbi:indole-3-pyruvate decarboxylase [Fictibacillus macauensis ZFHKF-1]|uniref:Alpha-keto-acid decarboxylase n=1 Tax=Fictibacillus macauensis ZFHKF-1 TaxID=1196324 RepID=I8ANI9_9BACL|nr:alpha-keto acid decarboxylase family protein [Fictibacillus macauensis]EIT87389.1 indole-3-pyruvate decarboxylase [Fictibacillus macauensis ZFHKF-1]
MNNHYTVGTYLLHRLSELGVRHMFGVPGDYNLTFLDDVIDFEGMEWIGNCNELNAAYAADGYARINGMAALVTTFGVGELSAINGIAGSYAEKVPVVKITGMPTTNVMNQNLYVHHTLGDGNFQHFGNMFQEVTAAQTMLTQENAAQEIDRVLLACWHEKRPVHINLPIDVYNKPVNPPEHSLLERGISSNATALEQMLTTVIPTIKEATSPVILADYEVYRYQAQEALMLLAEKTGFPVATLSMGKGVFNETHPQFIGVYNGDLSSDYVKNMVDHADCILSIGVKLTDSITGGFSHEFTEEQVIDISPYSVSKKALKWAPITMLDALGAITDALEQKPTPATTARLAAYSNESSFTATNTTLTQERFFDQVSHFLQEGDVILAEQGTSFFGAATMPLPKGATFIGQPLWGSIGYTLPALLGSQLADESRRNLLLIGDGSFQLTAQELSTMLRQRIAPIIFLINNDGYTVERAIHGENQVYNDIQMWDYSKLPAVFGAADASVTYKVRTEEELEAALHSAQNSSQLVFIEVMMEKNDTPELLTALSKRFANQNN